MALCNIFFSPTQRAADPIAIPPRASEKKMLGKRKRAAGLARSRKKKLYSLPERLRKKNPTFECQSEIAKEFRRRTGVLFNGRLHNYVSNQTIKRRCRNLGHTYGLCHLSVFNPSGKYKGLHILLRLPADRRVTKYEKSALSELERNGYAVAVCSGKRSAMRTLKHYMSGKHQLFRMSAFETSGGLTMDDLQRSGRTRTPIPDLKRKADREYRTHVLSVKRLVEDYPAVVVDGQPQGNLHRYKSDSYYTFVGNAAGYAVGCCDLLVWKTSGKYSGFAAEFKHGNNQLSPKQEAFISKLRNFGWYVCVPRSVEEFATEFNNYINL